MLAGWKNFQIVIVTADSDHLLDSIIKWCEFVVSERPVFLDAVQRPFLKVARRVAESNSVPVASSAAYDACPIHPRIVRILVTNGA